MLKYIETGDKTSCFGCSACAAICSSHAIELVPDNEGFLYPRLNTDKCTSCRMCERVCPATKEDAFLQGQQHSFALQAKDDGVLVASASGAAFGIAGRIVLERGGWVCGCIFEGKWKACHAVANDRATLNKMLGSKYVQSDMGGCYREIRELLKRGEEVLFSGTPCQVAGLIAYLQRPYEKLTTIDLICHGVPSQKLLDSYLEAEGESARVKEFSFRDKARNGWCSNGTIVKESKRGTYAKRTSPLDDTYYFYYYLENCVSRECCYTCPYSRRGRVGDLTIGDYWNADSAVLPFDFSKGTSAVIANSEKGIRLIDAMSRFAHIEKADLSHIVSGNGNLSEPCERPPLRDEVYQAIATEGYRLAAKRLCALKPWVPQMKRMLPGWIKKLMKRVKNGR